ncbi:MAG TPA: helix-turn-helix domain-containing protein [Halococcus sp.]|nr:helix-turn-helix domain-containing protein [Halococcus sp.]
MSEGVNSVGVRSHVHETAEATTAQVALPAEGFAFATLFEHVPDVRIDLESAVAIPEDDALVVIRTDEPREEVVATLQADPSVMEVTYLTDRRDGWLFRVTWGEQPRRFVRRVLTEDATILSARGQHNKWTFELLLTDRDALTRAYEVITDCECGTELERIGTYGGRGERFDLTDEQHEALVTAFEAGYYDIPRGLTAAELATKLDITHQALSERFRRGYDTLIAGIVAGGHRDE